MFSDYEILVTVAITVKGSDYTPCDWDGDEEAFRAEMRKMAVDGMRNGDLDIGDCWIESAQPMPA